MDDVSLRSKASGEVVESRLDTLRERVAEHFRAKWGYAEMNAWLYRAADDAIEALTPELDALRGRLRDLDRAIDEELAYRDANEEWADKLAYAVAPVESIGEHSNSNNPWRNALEILECCGYLAILPHRSGASASSEASTQEGSS